MCYAKALSELQNALGGSMVETLDSVWASNSQDHAPLPCDVRRELYHRLRSGSDSSTVDEDSQAPNPQDAYESKIDDPIDIYEIKAKVAFQKFLITVRHSYAKTHRTQSDFWDSMVKSLKEMLQTVYQKIVEALTWLRDTVSNAAHAVWDAIQRLFQSLKNLFSRS